MYLLKIEQPNGRHYYAGFSSTRPVILKSKASATRMDAKLASTVLRQLEHLGFVGWTPVDETDTDKAVELVA